MNKTCPKTGSACSGLCSHEQTKNDDIDKVGQKMLQMGNWYRPESLEKLMNLTKSFEENLKCRFVAGNTGTGNTSFNSLEIPNYLLVNSGL